MKSNLNNYWEEKGRNTVFYRNEEFYTTTSLPLYLFRREKVLSRLFSIIEEEKKSKGTINILDYGCGDGYYSAEIKKKYPEVKCYGFDTSESMINKAKAKAANCEFKVSNGEIPFDEKFDIVIIIAVLAHIPNLDTILKQIDRKINESGVVFIFEATASKHKEGEKWIHRTREEYIESFAKFGLKNTFSETVCLPFFNKIDKWVKNILRIEYLVAYKLFNKPLYYKKFRNINNSHIYLSLSEKLLEISKSMDKYLTKRDGNTILVYRRQI